MRSCAHRGRLRLKPRVRGIFLNHNWYCSESCFERTLQSGFHNASFETLRRLPNHRFPLGLILLSRNHIAPDQLRLALAQQEAQRQGRIGFWLRKLGFTGEQEIVSALSLQWSCPLISTAGLSVDHCPGILPAALILDLRLLPLQFSGKSGTVYAAFSERVDYAALNVIEHMLNCRTEQCVVSDSEMESALARIAELDGASLPGGDDVVLKKCGGPQEMARLVCDYGLRLQARDVKVAPCGRYFWVRFLKGQQCFNLLISQC